MVIAAALVFAGCIGEDDPVAETAVDESPAAASPAGGKPAASPAAPTPAETKDAPGVDEAEEEPTLVTVPFSVEGNIAASWCAPAGPNSCMGLGPTVGDDSSWNKVEAPGVLRHATLTLTWDASSPTTEQLRFALVRVKSCGDGCTEGDTVGDSVSGPSPLALDLALPELAEGEWFEVLARQARITPDPVYMWANLEQPFTIDGTLVAEKA